MPAYRTAVTDPALVARVVTRVPLHYTDGADHGLDRPSQVRAASGLARVPEGIAIVQDDANFVAVFDPEGRTVRAIALPAGEAGRRQFDDGRGNKQFKLDLEVCVAVASGQGTMLVAFGSGSTSRREQVAIIEDWELSSPTVTLVHVPRLFDVLRRETSFSGSQLNIEGAIHLGSRLRLFARGNGGPRAGVAPANATCDLDWPVLLAHLRAPRRAPPPAPTAVVRYDLGALEGIPLAFTDAAPSGDLVFFTAAAEQSPDVTRDGRVSGSAVGVIDQAGRARLTPIVLPSGALFAGKVEGLLLAERASGDCLTVVIDADDPTVASELCTVELRGPWWG